MRDGCREREIVQATYRQWCSKALLGPLSAAAEAPGSAPDLGALTSTSITGEHIIALIDQMAAVRSYPLVLCSDNGPEFVCDTIAAWAKDRIGLACIPPGTPWNNGYVQPFHARQRDECLNVSSFYSVLHAKVVITDWNHEYHPVRWHSSQ